MLPKRLPFHPWAMGALLISKGLGLETFGFSTFAVFVVLGIGAVKGPLSLARFSLRKARGLGT